WSGSPIPMKTTLASRAPASAAAAAARTAWSTISAGVRSRPAPMAPVAQKRQPRAQPARLDTHTVRRPPPWGMTPLPTPRALPGRETPLDGAVARGRGAGREGGGEGECVAEALPKRARGRADGAPVVRAAQLRLPRLAGPVGGLAPVVEESLERLPVHGAL